MKAVRRRGLVAAGAALAAVAGATAPASSASANEGRTVWQEYEGRFAPPRSAIPSEALTYRQDLVPAGARISVTHSATERGTRVGLRVSGLKADHRFGVHVHTRPCGADPEASGPHYQNRRDPVQPSTDPAYANPRNEIWMDLHTDAAGAGGALTGNRWNFRDGEARSVVVHEHATKTGHGEAGQAGDRVACFTVPFDGAVK